MERGTDLVVGPLGRYRHRPPPYGDWAAAPHGVWAVRAGRPFRVRGAAQHPVYPSAELCRRQEAALSKRGARRCGTPR